ncbi:cdk5 regulatory subunit associated protein 3 [Echinococcus multilocularis]|uniref:Cdk5 regulatory subunit associated protein 3 n=1 Tax=Echinococcus multilocularis TaxID=6211 RepID=A0A068YAV2_ECHMU|nr:cdk5 regulatory subunit associated protein 3 [Echinococcus multilocularis]
MPGSISVQSQKLIPWLVEHRVISKNYMSSMEHISKKIDEFAQSSPEKIKSVEAKPIRYFYALDVLNHLEQTDTTKDFFGRASALIRTWRDIVSRYESEHINIAEVTERLNDICYHLPKCKSAIADRQKLINDLQRKITEFTANQHSKEFEVERLCKQFGIKDEHARLQLLEKASTLPDTLNDYVASLKFLEPVVNFYMNFTSYLNSDSNGNQQVCPTLRLLIKSGHVTVYEWRTGYAPSVVSESDDYLPKMIELERKEIEAKEAEALSEDQEIDFADLDAGGETNLAEVDFGTDLLSGIDIVDLSKDTASKEDGNGGDVSCQLASKATTVATGANARLLLDSTEGRDALINDLEELASFLLRVRENLNEFQAADFYVHEAKKKKTGGLNSDFIAPIYHQIMLDAPIEVRSKTIADVDSMSSAVQKAFSMITEETTTHLSLLRLQPSYLERLICMMRDLRRQANRSRARVTELSVALQQANEELTALHTEMTECLEERGRLVAYLEKELSKLYERDIKLVGAAVTV